MYDNVWSKSVWIPFWILQLVAAAIFLAISIAALIVWKNSSFYYYDNDSEDSLDRAFYAVSGVYIGIAVLTIVVNVVEIILFARRRLNPTLTVVFNAILTVIWLAMFVILFLAARRGIFYWVIIIVIALTSTGKLAYSSVIVHRYRKRFSHRGGAGAYTSAATGVETELDSNGPYTAYNAGGSAAGPLRNNVSSAAGQHASSTASEYYDPESIRGYEMPPQHKTTTRYA